MKELNYSRLHIARCENNSGVIDHESPVDLVVFSSVAKETVERDEL